MNARSSQFFLCMLLSLVAASVRAEPGEVRLKLLKGVSIDQGQEKPGTILLDGEIVAWSDLEKNLSAIPSKVVVVELDYETPPALILHALRALNAAEVSNVRVNTKGTWLLRFLAEVCEH